MIMNQNLMLQIVMLKSILSINNVKEIVISKLQQESLNKANDFLDFSVTYDTVKETCSEGHLNINVDVASNIFWN